jgi:hypothetical protein
MNILRIMDEYIVDRIFQKISDRFQKLTGKSCFFLSQMCWIIAACFEIHLLFIEMSNPKNNVADSFLFRGLAAFVYLLNAFFAHDKDKNFALRSERMANFDRVMLREFRSIVTIVFVLIIIPKWVLFVKAGKPITSSNIIGDLICISIMAAFYFNACLPLPPSKSKVREWLESTKKFFAETFSPSPAAEPVPTKS